MSLNQFIDSLLAMDRIGLRHQLANEIAQGSAILTIETLVVPSLEEIGRRWEQGNAALSQVYMGGRIMEELVDEFLPSAAPERRNQPAMAIAVLEDYHLLGKRIIYSTLRASGLELTDYGTVSLEEILHHIRRDKIKILLISTLMLTSALRIKDLIQQLADLTSKPLVIAGGAPFRLDPQLVQEVGADATAAGAVDCLNIVNGLIEGNHAG